MSIYYTRCPVPTAPGVAFQRRMFAELFRESGYDVRDLNELGPDCRDVHYTHAVESFFREGGGAPEEMEICLESGYSEKFLSSANEMTPSDPSGPIRTFSGNAFRIRRRASTSFLVHTPVGTGSAPK